MVQVGVEVEVGEEESLVVTTGSPAVVLSKHRALHYPWPGVRVHVGGVRAVDKLLQAPPLVLLLGGGLPDGRAGVPVWQSLFHPQF